MKTPQLCLTELTLGSTDKETCVCNQCNYRDQPGLTWGMGPLKWLSREGVLEMGLQDE